MADRGMSRNLTCDETRERFSESADGELEWENEDAFRAHLDTCPECSEEFGRFLELSDVLDALPDPEVGERAQLKIVKLLADGAHHAPQAPEVMDVEDLVAYLRISPEELEEEIDGLPAFEFAGRLKFKKSAIDDWIVERQRERTRAIEESRLRAWRTSLDVG